MVSTRAMASFAEEKKDEYGDYCLVFDDPPQSTDAAYDSLNRNESTSFVNESTDSATSAPTKARKSPLLLLVCATGITSCYLWYGTIQEHIFLMDNTEGSESDKESITLFLLATGTFSSFLLACAWTIIGPTLLSLVKSGSDAESKRDSPSLGGRLNHPLIALTSLTYLSAMSASNESLLYVAYPTCVLAKSAKLIPTMIVGWLVDQWRRCNKGSKRSDVNTGKSINVMEWVGAILITVGIVSFQFIQLQKQSSNHHHGGNNEKGDSPYGLALLGLSLFMDGLMAACQNNLKERTDGSSYRPPSAMETMMYTNLYATLFLLLASHHVGQLQRGISIMCSNSSSKSLLLLKLNLSASLGQVFIFLTIHHFSPLMTTTITTTRKFFTILLSVYKFGHVLVAWQWISIGLVFCGLYLQIAVKLFEQHHTTHISGEHGVTKKKME